MNILIHKRILLTGCIKLLLTVFSICIPSILFAQSQIDFISTHKIDTIIAQDSILSSSFTFKNTGNSPLIITNIDYYPNSLKVDYKRSPIMPNETSNITISFNPLNYPTGLFALLKVYSNAQNNIVNLNFDIKIKENPSRPYLLYNHDFDGIKFKERNINLGDIIIGKNIVDSLEFYNMRDRNVNLEANLTSPFFEISFKPSNVKPKQKAYMYIVSKTTSKTNFYGYYYTDFKLIIDNSLFLFNKFYIYANFKEDFSKLTKAELNSAPKCHLDIVDYDFGQIESGKKYYCKFIITNKGERNLIIRKINTSCSCITILYKDKLIKSQENTILEVELDTSGKKGKILKAIYLTTNDPENPNITLMLKGVII